MPDAIDLPRIEVPAFPRADEYAGVWAIDPTKGRAIWEQCARADLGAHVAGAPQYTLRSEYQTVNAGNGQRIAVVPVTGTLMKAVGSMTAGTSTVAVRRDIRKAAGDPDVAAILVQLDSPGGTVSGTADLAADIRAAAKKKPVWAFAEDLCASAAFWLASQCDMVFANADTALIGSIGTLMVVYDLSGQAEKLGVKTLVFGTGPLKGAGAPGAEVTEDQQAYFRGMVEDAQRSFDAAVKSGRGLTDRQLEKAKTGGVFSAAEAADRKLIDGVRSYDAVIGDLAAEARRRSRATTTTRAEGPPERGKTVAEDTTRIETAEPTGAKPAAVADPIAESRKAQAAELRRQSDILARCAGHPGIAAEAIEQGWSPDAAELAVLKAKLPKSSGPANPHNPAFNPAVIDGGHDKVCTREALQAAVLLRSGVALDHKAFNTPRALNAKVPAWLRAGINDAARNRFMEAGHQFADLSMIDLARECVRLDGKHAPHAQDELFASAFSSGSSLTNIFTTNVNAVMLVSYAEAADTTGGWTSTTDVADFKTQERPRVDVGPGLTKLPRGKEADHSSYSDSAESYKIARFARQFAVDEQDMIDDSMNALSDVPRKHAQAAARLRPDLVYAILLANPTLTATARALFNTTDGNLGSSSALAAATLRTAIQAMMATRENSVNLNLVPTHLVVPTDLFMLANELVTSQTLIIAGTAGSVTERGVRNVISDLNLTVVSDARLTNGVTDPATATAYSGSASTWYLASTLAHTIEVAYRRGTGRMPMVRSFVLDKGKWGMGWDVNLDIGAKALDWKGLRKTAA